MPADEQARLRKRQRRQEEDAHRPLESWERYRALVDAFEHSTELINLADHRARFALVILGAFNAALYLGMRELTDSIPAPWPAWLLGLLGLCGLLAVAALLMAIEALRPRRRHPHLARPHLRPSEDEPAGLRSFHDALERDRDDYREAWRGLRISQLNAELAVEVHELARTNLAKDAALRWLYRGLQALTLLGATALLATGLQGVARTGAPQIAARALPAQPEPFAPGALREASGIAYHAGRRTLFAVGDRGHLVELDLAGRVLRDDALGGDLEDVVEHVPSGLLVLSCEKSAELLVFDPAAGRATARIRLDRRGLLGERPRARNSGFEGLAFQPFEDRPGGGLFHLVHQDDPPLIVSVVLDPMHPPTELGSEAVVARSSLPGEASLSAACWLPSRQKLLVLARRGPRLLLARDGVVETAFALPTGQPEGIALGPEGDLLVADERAGLLRVRGFSPGSPP